MDQLGVRLREERERLQLSQAGFAALGGIAPNAQCHYENAKRIPIADYLAAIGHAGVDVLYVTLGQRTPLCSLELTLTVQELTTLDTYRQINVRDQIAIEQLLLSLSEHERPHEQLA